jgi:CheY-like chemotaxis protein
MSDGSILLVDDDEGVRHLLKLTLGKLNRPFREASDGREALDQVAEAHPALIILDLMMPRMTGADALRRLRADPATASIPVMLFTAFHVSEAEQAELRLDPCMVLTKGNLTVGQMREAVAVVLEGGRC